MDTEKRWAPGKLIGSFYVDRPIDGTTQTLHAWGPKCDAIIEVLPADAFEKPAVVEWFAAHVARLRGLPTFLAAGVNCGDRGLMWSAPRGIPRVLLEPVAREQAIAILREVARLLAKLHSLDIVHGALRPDTILVQYDESEVTLLAVGLDQFARLYVPMWNPRYEAPEQIEHRTSCKATDVRALALLAYELLEGRRLIDADSMQQLYQRILIAGPDVVELPARPAFERCLRACLQRDPERRPQDPIEALEQLLHALQLDEGGVR